MFGHFKGVWILNNIYQCPTLELHSCILGLFTIVETDITVKKRKKKNKTVNTFRLYQMHFELFFRAATPQPT